MDELISRQALLDEFEQWQKNDGYSDGEWNLLVDVLSVIKSMPPAPQLGTNLAEVGTDVPDKNVGELISRQSAVDELVKMLSDCFYADEEVLDAVETTLKELPSAQPEPCEDVVSRKTILKFLDDWMSALEDNVHNQSASDLKIIKKDFENLPSAQPELKKGKWIKTARWGRVYYCNQCRNYLDFDGVNAGRGSTNFCPNCGADMRGEQDDSV